VRVELDPQGAELATARSISASVASTSSIGTPATKPTNVSGRSRTSSAIESLPSMASSALASPSASIGGAARLMICA
jgi:hypothetical protein